MKTKLKNNKGITLVALIITIIVLLILAIVSIRLVMNGGIIDRAERGTRAYSDAEVEEQLKLAYQEYQMAKFTENQLTIEQVMEKTGLDIISIEENDTSGYDIMVNTKNGGKLYELQTNGTVTGVVIGPWTQNGTTITNLKTNQTLEIGQKVNYDEGIGYTFTTDTSKGMGISASSAKNSQGKYDLIPGTYTTEDLNWVVLGASKKGQVELISVTPHSEQVTLANEEAYLNGPIELNKLCNALYGKGTGAQEARSLKVTDINILANYNPEEIITNNSMYPRFNGYRKYIITNDGKYEYSDSIDGQTNWGNPKDISYFGVKDFTMIGKSKPIISEKNPGETVPIKHTAYSYDAKEQITSTISESFANMIVDSSNNQWLASKGVVTGTPDTGWRLFCFNSGGYVTCSYDYLYSSLNYNYKYTNSFRSVVILSSNVNLQWNSTSNQWDIQ